MHLCAKWHRQPSTGHAGRIRELLSDLYRFELRSARRQHRELVEFFSEQPLEPLREEVSRLRDKYWMLSVRRRQWDWKPSGVRSTGPFDSHQAN